MQRLIYIRSGTPSLNRVVDICQQTISTKIKDSIIRRCLSTNSSKNNENDLGIDTKSYKPSTAKTETHIPDDLKGGQRIETIGTAPASTATLTGGGKVWSVQNPDSVHIAPLGAATATFVSTPHGDGIRMHETTVHTAQGELNFGNPFTTHTLQPEATPGQLAEAAAASAFETFAPDTPLETPIATDTVFAPKISSTDLYSTASSPTGQFENATGASTIDSIKYETSTKSQVFGGQDTSAGSKKHPQADAFASKKTDEKSAVQEIPVQRESDIRDEILRESLKYVNERGWTMDAIRAGVRASNQPTTVEGLFSNGYDLVEYFMLDANRKMAAYMNEKAKSGEKQGGSLLVDGLKYRLGLVIPYAATWDQALAQGALPQNAMRGWKNLLDLSSDAWHGIGDTSTDINWYSKRLLLAAAYKSAEIYMLQDQSPDKIDTMQFLERRLNDFQTMSSVRNSVSKSLSDTAQIASGLFSVVRNLTSRR